MKSIILVLSLVSTTTYAGFIDGSTLFMRMYGTPQEQAYTLGYVAGVAEDPTLCIPDGTTVTKLHDIIKGVYTNVPEVRKFSASELIKTVLTKTYPCKAV